MDAWQPDRVGAAERGENPTVLARMPSGFAVIGDTRFLPGYCVLLVSPRVDTLQDLELAGRSDFLPDMSLAGDAVAAMCHPRRLNYAICGNTDAFLHARVFPRYEWEPAEYASLPPFRYPRDRWTDPRYLLAEERHTSLKAELQVHLRDVMAKAGRTPV